MLFVNVLGTVYTIEILSSADDRYLKEMSCDGYCDKTSKRIVVRAEDETNELENYEVYKKTCLRHEIIHAFLFESGLQQNFKHEQWGHDETMIDWFAVQFPKLQKVFEQASCL